MLCVTFFPGQFSTRDMTHKVDVLIGVSPDGIGLYSFHVRRGTKVVFFFFFFPSVLLAQSTEM